MDLRMVKTKNAIYEAYMTLRKKHAPEKIKVVDICQLAQINKSTFYKHYHDVFELSEELTKETFERFWEGFEEKDLMLTAPKEFLVCLPKAVDKLGESVLSAFFRNGEELFFALLEEKLIDRYVLSEDSYAERLKTTFIICGMIHILKEQRINRRCNNDSAAEAAEKIILSMENMK